MRVDSSALAALLGERGRGSSLSSSSPLFGPVALAVWDSKGAADFFRTTFRVPAAPTLDSGQGIFISPAIQPAKSSSKHAALKPVLEWGPTASGGTKAWSVQTYYISGSASSGIDIGVYSDRQVVQSGDELVATIRFREKRKVAGRDSYFYTCEFEGIKGTFIGVDVPEPFVEFGVGLQIYGASSCQALPSGSAISLKTEIKAGKVLVDPAWQLTSVDECGMSITASANNDIRDEIIIAYDCTLAL